MATSNVVTAKAPESLIQLFIMIGKALVKGIPRLLKKSLLKIGLIFLAILIFNTYLLVVKNEGFAPTPDNPWLDFTALKGNIGWVTAFWTFAMFLVTSIVGRIKEDGFKQFTTDLTDTPQFFKEKMHASGKKGLPTLLMTVIGVLLATLLIPNKGTLLLYTLIAFLSFTKKEESFLLIFFTLFRSDMNKIFHFKSKIRQSDLFIMGFSVWVAILLAYILRRNLYIILLCLVLAGIVVYLKTRNKGAKTMVIMLLFVGASLVYNRLYGRVLADDGGWVEAGGTLIGWIRSQGAGLAVGMGVPPAAGGIIGALIGMIYSGLNPSDLVPSTTVFTDIFEDYAEFADDFVSGVGEDISDGYDSLVETGEEAVEFADDFVTGVGEDISDGYDSLVEAGEEAVEFAGDFADGVKDSLTPGDSQPIAEGVVADDLSLDNQVDYTNILSNLLGIDEVGNGLKNTITQLLTKPGEFSKFMQDVVQNSDDYVKVLGDSKSRLNWIRDAFKNSKAGSYMTALEGGLTFLGMGFDAFGNVEAGDETSVAIAKSAASNATAFLAGKTGGGPTLAAWELANHVLFGGTKASNVWSPVASIKGSMNWALDYAGGMDPKSLASRMDSGYYGENVKNLYYGSGYAKDFVADPGKFYDEVGNFTRAGDEGWAGMNKTVDDLFRLPDEVRANTKDLYSTNVLQTVWDSPLDSTRKVATDAAHLATKTAVKVGEGWAYIGDAAGTGSVWVEQKASSGWQYVKSFF